MIGKLISIDNPYHVFVRQDQLQLREKGGDVVASRPMEDISTIILNHPRITLTQHFIQTASRLNVTVIFCDQKHHPSSLLFHLDTNTVQSERFRTQIGASPVLKKQLWQQTIKAKINNQAAVLAYAGKDDQALKYLAKQVKSGDSDNEEAQAARRYWPKLFNEDFTREREGIHVNPSLNYGYAILRAATARALSGSGLLPTLGIHHRNKYNAFCLADDIMEPYRPFVDRTVWEMWQEGLNCSEIGKEERTRLLEVLQMDTVITKVKRPLQVALTMTTSSLYQCYNKTETKLKYARL